MKNELVSIIVPVYNGASVVGRAIESVLRQNYSNIELIIIDDGSTDDTKRICDKYAERYSYIRVFSIPNGGVSNARNYGISVSHGEYIAFLDADDELVPEFISISMKLMKENYADVVATNASYAENGVAVSLMQDFSPKQKLIKNTADRDVLVRQLYTDTPNFYYGYYLRASWGKLYKTGIIKNNDIKFPEGVPFGEDAIFLLEVFLKARKIFFKNEYLYLYYKSDESATGRHSCNYYEKKVAEYNALKSELSKVKYQIRDIDLIFWHRTMYEFYANSMKADESGLWKIGEIRNFLKKPYPKQYLIVPYNPGSADKIRALLMKSHMYVLLAVLEYINLRRKLKR